VERGEWFKGGNNIIKRGGYASLYDIDTGLTLRIKRKGGTNHMDVEPATKADTATLKKIAGGTFSWKSHAVVLIAKGRYIAAAINTMPHGEYTIKDNGFPGQFCLHMVGSKTHETDRVNPEQSAPPVRLVPPYTYGFPTKRCAYSAIFSPLALVSCELWDCEGCSL
jgi:hypothetical protein